ncbi:MAG: radical SAM protein [Spirulina sp.]
MRVGILEVIDFPCYSLTGWMYNLLVAKQYASVTPQAISVWCRQLGYETFYAAYYGMGNPSRLLPQDLDIIFFACCTPASPLAYALAKIYRQKGIRTVIGGAHAESFPVDCLRFFDLVLKHCDRELIANIVKGEFESGQYISRAKPFDDCPTVEERMPEIKASAFFHKNWPGLLAGVPIITSMGCPYTCDFCRDWDNPYRLLSTDRFAVDLEYLRKNYPHLLMFFHEPNFAVQFDRIFQLIEAIPPESRLPYVMECSLSVLTESRMKRLKETNCVVSFHGIESWQDYSVKAGTKGKSGSEKVNRVAKHLEQINENVTYVQFNMMFALDSDAGDEPVNLTKSLMEKAPFAWPVINIPAPFGGTPMFDQYFANKRILEEMPFVFYIKPYLVTTLKHYDPIAYFEKMIEMVDFGFSWELLKRRIRSTSDCKIKALHIVRNQSEHDVCQGYHKILALLRSDSQFRAFHEGTSTKLPEFYHQIYEKKLGRYAKLLSRADRRPCLEQLSPQIV